MIDLCLIDVVMAILFLYLLICLVGSVLRESIENILNRPAANLEEAIRQLFGIAEEAGKSAKADGLAATSSPTTS